MFVPFLIGTIAIVLMFQINLYMNIAKSFDTSTVPKMAIVQAILFNTPTFLVLTLPAGCSLAGSLSMTRLARESELTAMRASGASIRRVLFPYAMFGAIVAVLTYVVGDFYAPKMMSEANRRYNQIGALGMSAKAISNVPLKLQEYSAFLGAVAREDNGNFSATDVFLARIPQPGIWSVITAKKAVYKNGIWTIEDGILRQFNGEDLVSVKPQKAFTINHKINILDLFQMPIQDEQTSVELYDLIKREKSQGRDGKAYGIKFHTRFSVPAACIVFAYISPVFAILFSRSGGFAGVLLSVFLVMLYYNAFVICTDILGKIPTVPDWVAGWLPNILFMIIGMIGVRRLE